MRCLTQDAVFVFWNKHTHLYCLQNYVEQYAWVESYSLENLGIICEHKLSTSLLATDPQAGTNCRVLQLLKICQRVSGNRLGRQSNNSPLATHVSWQFIFWNTLLQTHSMWGHFGLYPPAFTRFSSPSPPLYPSTPLSGCQSPREEGRGSQGQSLFLFGSRGLLGEAWRENGCIRAGVGGQDFNSVKEQLVWVFLHVALPSLSPQIQGDEKFVQMGTSKIKKVYGPKPLPLPCSSIREECNNVSIWPQLDWLKTRKSFLGFGVLTAGWNLIKKLKMFEGFFILETRGIHFLVFHFSWEIINITLNRWDKLFWQLRNHFKILSLPKKWEDKLNHGGSSALCVIHTGLKLTETDLEVT